MKVGVFDSGVGGLSVVKAIERAYPELEIVYKEDRKNMPYGDKSVKTLKALVMPIMQSFVDEGCEIIIIACNTITTNLSTHIRKHIPIPIIGIEPMIKPASITTVSGIITVCATPATLQSDRYQHLKAKHALDIKVIEPDCSDWAYLIEHNESNTDKIEAQIRFVCEQGSDVIVLGCTHYHWIQDEIQQIASEYNAQVIQPEDAIVSRLRTVLAQLA